VDGRREQGEPMRQLLSTPRGLTILEILGVIIISSLLLSGAWQLFQSGMQSYHRGLQDVRMVQRARILVHMVTRDVQRAMAARVPYGIRGTEPQRPTSNPAGRQGDRLAMLTLPAPVAPPEGTRHSSVPQHIRYALNAMPDSKTLVLQRAVGTPREPQRERVMVVHEHIQEFSVRYFDGQMWHAAWQRAELPQAVEIILIVQSGGTQARASRFATLVTAD
jgi:type II secretion system protein J